MVTIGILLFRSECGLQLNQIDGSIHACTHNHHQCRNGCTCMHACMWGGQRLQGRWEGLTAPAEQPTALCRRMSLLRKSAQENQFALLESGRPPRWQVDLFHTILMACFFCFVFFFWEGLNLPSNGWLFRERKGEADFHIGILSQRLH